MFKICLSSSCYPAFYHVFGQSCQFLDKLRCYRFFQRSDNDSYFVYFFVFRPAVLFTNYLSFLEHGSLITTLIQILHALAKTCRQLVSARHFHAVDVHFHTVWYQPAAQAVFRYILHVPLSVHKYFSSSSLYL